MVDSHRPPQGWPAAGEVKFEGVSLRYRPELPPVLRDLSFTVRAGEKVGIVGRTGAGKSSLVVALMRLVEPEAGRVVIDGKDTSRMGLEDLRSAISVIPQVRGARWAEALAVAAHPMRGHAGSRPL